MAKSKANIPSILEAVKEIKKEKLKPVYYFSGDDSFGIDSAYKILEEKVTPLLASDFDKEVFYGEGKALGEILNSASSFPFGSSKKFVVVKESEKIKAAKRARIEALRQEEEEIEEIEEIEEALRCEHDRQAA